MGNLPGAKAGRMSLFCSFFASTDTGDTRACMSMRVPGAGGAPRQAQVSPAGRGMGIPAHSCDRNDIDTFLSTPFLSTGMRGNARSPARKHHLGLPGGAAGAMDACAHPCTKIRAPD